MFIFILQHTILLYVLYDIFVKDTVPLASACHFNDQVIEYIHWVLCLLIL